MTARASRKKPKRSAPDDSKSSTRIRFTATLLKPVGIDEIVRRGGPGDAPWTFLKLPSKASAKLPSRGQVTVEGTINGAAFGATLEPDGAGGHWLRVDRVLRAAAGDPEVGEVISFAVAPVPPEREPEPAIPPDVRKALAKASKKAMRTWADITPAARRDFVHWITSARQAATRAKRIATACDMLAKGKRRPCCFDRSGMYGGGLTCPSAEGDASGAAG